MPQAELSSPRRTRLAVVVVVLALHVAAILALIRAFAPALTDAVVQRATAILTVDLTAPSPPPEPSPSASEPAGAAAEAGKRATPREAAAPKPRIVVASPSPAPPVAGQGNDAKAGAQDSGQGTGAGGRGSGTGAGTGGSGSGAGRASKPVKIAGDINSARDYPKGSRELRLGDHVVVALAVGADGRVKACRVHRPSRDPEADRITCRLATERFRFKPALDAGGNATESFYGWQQRWYDPRPKD